MKKLYKLSILISMAFIAMTLSSCAETAENEHLPEYCQTYSGFMATSSKDLYDLLENVNRDNYLSVISTISLEFEVDNPGVEVDLNGIQCFQNLTSLTLIGQSFKDISEISALKNIQKISLIDTSVVSINSFKNLSKVNDLTISNAKSLQSVDGIEEMTKLVNLDLTDNGIVNIEGLNNLVNLETLDLSNNEIVTFPSINALQKLTVLTLNNNDITYLGTDLSGLSNLETFEARHNNITDISSLDDLTSLVTLDLSYNNLGDYDLVNGPDFSSLENAPNLENIYLQFNDLTSIEGLRDKDIPLKKLVLNDNLISNITPIANFTGLVELQLFNNNISDIDDLSGMINLIDIDLRNNLISDFTDLLTIPNVEFVNLRGNQITFIPDIKVWESIVSLNLHSNLISDTSGVEGSLSLEELIIANNGLEILSGISGMPYLENLVIDTEEEIDEETLLPLVFTNPNVINTIDNSFNNLERLELTEEGDLILDFNLEDNLKIYASFNGLYNVVDIDFSGMSIDIIDSDSINLENLHGLNVSNNNISDLSFILGNSELEDLRIGNNNFTNLEIISGVTTDDLSNLQNIFANDITVGNALDNAFNELNNLSYLDLSGTNITEIDNSFNSLPELSTFLIDSENLESIVDSFNLIFASASEENSIVFDAGSIGLISNSFNGGALGSLETGKYEQIRIRDQVSAIVNTEISDSFNYITGSFSDSIVISGNSFKTISNSFNESSFQNVLISGNNVESITSSLTNTVIDEDLYLSVNKLEDISTISSIASVTNLNLSNNRLTSVISLDGIVGLESVDISSQYNTDTLTYTLTDLDGLNNMPSLTDFDISLNQFDTISGLKDIGISNFTYQIIDNNNQAFVIDPLAFTGTSLTTLDLDGSLLTDISFLGNLDTLETLVIDVNVNPTLFTTAEIDDTLLSLDLFSSQEVLDFSIFETYDSLVSFVLDTTSNTSITNLDNMDDLEIFTITNEENITSISNSFNNLPAYVMNGAYLSTYINLTTINNSFDSYSSTNYLIISDDTIIIDSFNSAPRIQIENTDRTSPRFDNTSFLSVVDFRFTDPQYTSYTFLDDYSELRNVLYDNLDLNITDLVNLNIMTVDIDTLGNAVNSINIDTNPFASLSFTTSSTGLITIDSNLSIYSITGLDADITIIHDDANLAISGNLSDLLINTSSLVNLDISFLIADSLNVDSNVLANITSSSSITANVSLANITSQEETLNMDIKTDLLNLYAVNANNITVSAPSATFNLYGAKTSIIGDIDTDTLNVNNSSLLDLTLSSPTIDTINIDAPSFNNLLLTSSNIETLNLTTNVASLSVAGSIGESNILDNSLNNLTLLSALSNNSLNLSTSNNQAFTLDITTDNAIFNAPNLPSLTLSNSSVLSNGLILGTMNSNDNLSLGSADIASVTLVSTEASFTMDASNLGVAYLDLVNASTLDLDIANSIAIVDSGVLNLSADLKASRFEYVNLNASSFTLTDTSQINNLIFENTDISLFTLGNANISNSEISTISNSLTISSPNSANTVVSGNNLTSFNANLGIGNVDFTSSNTGPFTTNVTANQYNLDIAYDDVAIDNASAISTITFDSSSNLNTLNAGNAVINQLSTLETAATLDLTGNMITSLNIKSAILNSLTTNLDSATELSVTSSTASNVTINTDVVNLNATALNANQTNIISASLENADVSGKDIYYDLSKAALAFTIDGSADKAYITSTTIDSLSVLASASISELSLIDTEITSLDLTNGEIDILNMDSTGTSLDVTAASLNTININSNTLNTLNVDGSNSLSLFIVADNGLGPIVFDISGDVNNLTVLNDSLVTMNTENLDVFDVLSLTTSSLTDYNELSSNINELFIVNSEAVLNVLTQTSNFSHQGNTSSTLNMTTSVPSQEIVTTGTVVNLDGATTDFDIVGLHINTFTGSTANLEVASNSSNATNFNIEADDITISNSNSSSLIVSTVGTINNLSANMNNLTTYNESGVSLTTNITTLESAMTLVSSAQTVSVNGNVNGILVINGLSLDSTITSNMKSMTISDFNESLNIRYIGSLHFDVLFGVLNNVSFESLTSLSNTFTGTVTNLEFGALNSTDLEFINLEVTDTLNLDNLGITDLSMISANIVSSVQRIEINTLENSNIEDIITLLKDTSITLVSPIESNDIYTYYYNLKVEELTLQESIDNVLYQGYRDAEISDILSDIFRTNAYFFYNLDPELENDIDTQDYEDMQYYFDSYLVGENTTELELIEEISAASVEEIKTLIQATLDDPALIINEVTLQELVTSDIASSSDSAATNQTAAVGFILETS